MMATLFWFKLGPPHIPVFLFSGINIETWFQGKARPGPRLHHEVRTRSDKGPKC